MTSMPLSQVVTQWLLGILLYSVHLWVYPTPKFELLEELARTGQLHLVRRTSGPASVRNFRGMAAPDASLAVLVSPF